jgi:hypothetical protein
MEALKVENGGRRAVRVCVGGWYGYGWVGGWVVWVGGWVVWVWDQQQHLNDSGLLSTMDWTHAWAHHRVPAVAQRPG